MDRTSLFLMLSNFMGRLRFLLGYRLPGTNAIPPQESDPCL
jgi:hypothetical protein